MHVPHIVPNCSGQRARCGLHTVKSAERTSTALQEGRQAARAEKLAEIRAGNAKSDKTAEQKASGKAFAAQMRTDSDYQGEDYEARSRFMFAWFVRK